MQTQRRPASLLEIQNSFHSAHTHVEVRTFITKITKKHGLISELQEARFKCFSQSCLRILFFLINPSNTRCKAGAPCAICSCSPEGFTLPDPDASIEEDGAPPHIGPLAASSFLFQSVRYWCAPALCCRPWQELWPGSARRSQRLWSSVRSQDFLEFKTAPGVMCCLLTAACFLSPPPLSPLSSCVSHCVRTRSPARSLLFNSLLCARTGTEGYAFGGMEFLFAPCCHSIRFYRPLRPAAPVSCSFSAERLPWLSKRRTQPWRWRFRTWSGRLPNQSQSEELFRRKCLE